LLVQGVPPQSEYRFKHALIQDAAYENLLKSRRQILHCRVGEALRDTIAPVEPELLAHHFSQGGLPEAAIEWWGKAAHRSLERSALVEAVAQFTRAIDLIATLPGTRALRREQIKLQVALINALHHVKGYAAPESKAAVERARLLIEQAEGLGEPPEDPLLLFTVLYGVWAASWVAFNGDICRDLAAHFLALAETQGAKGPRMIGHRLMGLCLAVMGDFVKSREHFDQAIALYDPAKHRTFATRFGTDSRVSVLSSRSWTLWALGYPEKALADSDQALKDAGEIAQAATLMHALAFASWTHICCGNYAAAEAQADKVIALADQKGTVLWKALGMLGQGSALALTGKASDAVQVITAGLTALQATGAATFVPWHLSYLARAYMAAKQFPDAWRCVGDAMAAMEKTKDKWLDAEVHRVAGEIALASSEPDVPKAQSYFERAIAVARQQQAKSWELRASMSLARLRRSQGKVQQAHELLAPVYGWFSEGFETRDLKEAKALLEELA
jgi:predicted ATPase